MIYIYHSITEIIQSYRITVQNISDDNTLISDIWSTKVIQSDWIRKLFESNNDNKWAIALQFALDRVQTYILQNNKVWPLICLNLNLLPCIRFREDNILPLTITSGPNELVNIDSFLSSIMNEVQWLSKDRVQYYDVYTEERFILRVHIVICTSNTLTIAKLLSMKKSTVKHYCRFCCITEKLYKRAEGVTDQREQLIKGGNWST